MTKHLPECPLATDCKHDYYNEPPVQCANCGEVCVCDLLRACEQRVEKAERAKWSDLAHDNWQDGWEEGIQAAREAVAAYLEQGTCVDCSYTSRDAEVLAAIDGLRGES